jgi:hypothetical protein
MPRTKVVNRTSLRASSGVLVTALEGLATGVWFHAMLLSVPPKGIHLLVSLV